MLKLRIFPMRCVDFVAVCWVACAVITSSIPDIVFGGCGPHSSLTRDGTICPHTDCFPSPDNWTKCPGLSRESISTKLYCRNEASPSVQATGRFLFGNPRLKSKKKKHGFAFLTPMRHFDPRKRLWFMPSFGVSTLDNKKDVL